MKSEVIQDHWRKSPFLLALMERCVPEASWCDMIVCRVIMLVRRATISKFVVRMSIPKLRREHFPAGPPELSQHRLISIASSEGTLNCGALGPIRLLMAWKTATTTIKEECSKGCTSSNDSNVKLCLLLRHSLSVCRITKRNLTRQTKKKKKKPRIRPLIVRYVLLFWDRKT